MKTFEEAIEFIKEFHIECDPKNGCGQCNETRKAIEIITQEVDRLKEIRRA